MSVISNKILINTEEIDGKEIKIYSCTIDGFETYSVNFQNGSSNVNLTLFCIYAMDGDEYYTGMIHWPFNSKSEYSSSEYFIEKNTQTAYVNGYNENDDSDKIEFIKRNVTLFMFQLSGIIFETEKSNEEEDEEEGIIVSGHIAFDITSVIPKIIYKGNVRFDTYCPILNEQIFITKCESIRYNKTRVFCNVINGHNDSYVWTNYPLPITTYGTFTSRKEIDKWIINNNLEYTYSINYTKAEERNNGSGVNNDSFFTDYNVIIQKDEQGNGIIVKFHKEKKNDKDVIFDVNGTKTVIIEEGCILECDLFKC